MQTRIANAKKKKPDFMTSLSSDEEEAAIEKTMARLKELNYLDDEKFAKMWLSTRLSVNPKGAFALRIEMQKKGIPKEVFEKVWEEVHVSDEVLAERILEQKKRTFERLDPDKRKRKIMYLLASRGIRPGVVYRFLEKFKNEE